jgi:hypothetical protein
MTPQASLGQVDHSAYIAAVCHQVEAQDISTVDVRIGVSPEGRREAAMRLKPGDSAPVDQVPLDVSVSWDEEYGWSLLARYDSIPPVPGSPVHKGLTVLPDPDDVAAWIIVLLARPDVTPSREDGPYRDCSSADPAFEVQLAHYIAVR